MSTGFVHTETQCSFAYGALFVMVKWHSNLCGFHKMCLIFVDAYCSNANSSVLTRPFGVVQHHLDCHWTGIFNKLHWILTPSYVVFVRSINLQ